MNNRKIIFVIAFGLFGLSAIKLTNDVIAKLGMQHDNVQYYILKNFIGRYPSGEIKPGDEGSDAHSVFNQLQSFRIPYAAMLQNIITGDKTGATVEMLDYVRKYVNSEEFIAQYTMLKEEALPLGNLSNLKKNNEVYKLNIKNYPNDKKYVAEQQRELDNNQASIDKLIELSKKPFPNKDIWENTYPEDPAFIIRARLKEYLQLEATVDYTAKLTGSGKNQTFVNPLYEKKSLKWKAIYRAGKDVNTIVKEYVNDWLKGEIISSTKTKMTVASQNNDQRNKEINNTSVVTEIQSENIQEKDQVKEKPSLLNKLKDKTKSLVKKK